MISIIICSRNEAIDAKIYHNIEKTIGTEFELIWIDNSKNKYSIFSAYNEGVAKARGTILCFMHEDVILHTNNWGGLVNKHLRDESVGIIGVFGGHYIPNMYPVTYVDGPVSGIFTQGFYKNGDYYTSNVSYTAFKVAKAVECVVVDGMWFCARKSLFDDIRFDDRTFHGFHCYDLDICMQSISHHKKIEVVFDIHIEHKSAGVIDNVYFKQLKIWYQKWHDFLPVLRGIDKKDIPVHLLSIEDFCTFKMLEKEKWKRMYEDTVFSKRYRILCKLLGLLYIFKHKR